jgi:hypothetical protein
MLSTWVGYSWPSVRERREEAPELLEALRDLGYRRQFRLT